MNFLQAKPIISQITRTHNCRSGRHTFSSYWC